MSRIAYAAVTLALGAVTLTACSGNPVAKTIAAENVTSNPARIDTDKSALEFMELALKITEGCPPLDETKAGDHPGPEDVPHGLQESSGTPTGSPGDRMPRPSGPDPAPVDDGARPKPDAELLEPVTLTTPEICMADKFAAHVTSALKGVGGNAAELRAALNGAGYPDERIVDMNSEGGSARARIDLRLQDDRVALEVVHTGSGAGVVEGFGVQHSAPLKDVRHVPGTGR
ncbi:hypothetical protein [Streptomyces sp. NPDC096339]|uniref:hypothetical protein n=1 Tax=Streptomyces sp. NPDC096339 TaxID=3366086 RepID=UPI003830AD85